MEENLITQKIIGAAIKVNKDLGPGVLESAHKECLYYQLIKDELYVEKEKPLPLVYDEVKLECGYRVDLPVENKIIVEIKAVESLNDIHLAQILNYLKRGNNRIGLLINFNEVKLTDGLKRVINKYYKSPWPSA
ncbi:MAG: GxxExxY protein [Cytophagales bacterium]|nr:GxxExxY protein [Cytophagales bacterium]